MTSTVTVGWEGQERSFDPDQVVVVGRDPSCEVVVANANVSRRHAELRHDGTTWRLHDLGSRQGVFVDGAQVGEVALGPTTTVTLARPGVGTVLQLRVTPLPPPPAPGPGPGSGSAGAPDAATAGTVLPPDLAAPGAPGAGGLRPPGALPLPGTVLPEDLARPGGHLRADQVAGATVVTGHALNLECGGRSYTFQPGREITIGRDPACDVVSANPTVSRRHAALRHDGTRWRLDDLGSAGGTWVDGRRVPTVALEGSSAVFLGDPDTGERVVLVTSGTRQYTATQRLERATRRRGPLVLVGVGALALVALVAGAIALLGGGDDGPADALSADELLRAAVYIETSPRGSGSGTVIDAEQGLILTNAHVVDPRAPGIAQLAYGGADTEDRLPLAPTAILVGVADEAGETAELRFRAEVVAVDGYLDAAVVRITGRSSGAFIEDGDLEVLREVPVGSAAELGAGDNIRIVGFPGISASLEPSLTRGVVSSGVGDARLRSNRGWLNVDAQIAPGNSGGMAVDDQGRLVGVPTAGSFDRTSGAKADRVRPVDFMADLIAKARAGQPYVSPYVTPLTGTEKVTTVTSVVPTQFEGFRPVCDASPRTAQAGEAFASLAIAYEGFTPDAHQDLRVLVVDRATNEVVGRSDTADQFPFPFAATGCVSVTVDLDGPLSPRGDYVVAVYLGANAKPSGLFDPF